MSCPKKSRGFTLIELLITISIIAILSAIGLVAYSTVLKQGRDSKRQSDLRSIQSALEQYNSDQGFYPAPSPSPFTPGNSLNNCTGNPNTPCSSTKVYLNTIPSDPISSPSPNYCYKPLKSAQDCSYVTPNCSNTGVSADRCSKYCLYAKLENQPAGSSSCGATSTYNSILTPP